MQEDSIKLLKECSSGCKMAIQSIDQIYEYAKDPDMRRVLDDNKDKHKILEQKIGDALEQYGCQEEKPKTMATMMSWITVEMKMLMEADNHQIAKVMMDGCNMGIQSVCEYDNKYAGASEESHKLAQDIIKTEEKFVENLKKFL